MEKTRDADKVTFVSSSIGYSCHEPPSHGGCTSKRYGDHSGRPRITFHEARERLRARVNTFERAVTQDLHEFYHEGLTDVEIQELWDDMAAAVPEIPERIRQ